MKYSFFLRIESVIGLTVILFVWAGLALSQPKFGAIVGTVRDSSGALLPNCVITVERAGTSFSRSTMADDGASYAFPNLAPGVYKLSMMAPGFQVAEYARVQLLARQTVRIDGKMQLASQTENVAAKAVPSAFQLCTYQISPTEPHPSERSPSFNPGWSGAESVSNHVSCDLLRRKK